MVRQEPAKLPFPSSNLGTTFFMLYLVSTPIGNLGDFSERAREVLSGCDYILCEDTRRSSILLNHYQITTPLKSFHQFSEAKKEEGVIEDLRAEKEIALISDAGTPLISDPGHRLVTRCREEGLCVTAIPGACAVICALTLSTFAKEPFHFWGFFPKKKSERENALLEVAFSRGTSVFYLSPHDLEKALADIVELAPKMRIGIARELTKRYEEIIEGRAEELSEHFREKSPKGEFVLLIEGKEERELENSNIAQCVRKLQEEYGLSTKEAIEAASILLQIGKRRIYQEIHR